MQSQHEIDFKNKDTPAAMQALIEERTPKPERLFGRIAGCRIYVAPPHGQHRTRNRYAITIEVRLPGTELAVDDNPGDIMVHDNFCGLAVHDPKILSEVADPLAGWRMRRSSD